MLRRRPLVAGLSVSLAIVLAACTATPDAERGPSAAPSADPHPAPEVTVSVVDDDDASATPTSAAGSSGTPEADSTTGAADADGKSIELDPSGHFALTVSGGEFTEVTVTDADHPEVSVDGTFDSGTEGSDPSAPATASATETQSANAGGGTSGAGATPSAGGTPAGDSTDREDGTPSGASTGSNDSAASGGDADGQGTRWVSSYGLAGNAAYEWTATTVAPDGATHEASGTITTTEPQGRSARIFTVIGDDQEVGVAAPIIVNIGATVPESYRDDIEHRLSVEVTDEDGKQREVEGSWGWLYDTDGISRVHYRPKEFWPEHSKVKVKMALEDVPFSQTRFGEKDVSLDFSIGREQTVTADAKTHRMIVTRGDETIMDYPASLGAARSPSYNGTHIVMSKAANYTMTSERWGYSTPVRWAVRIHNNGEFIHGAPWSAGSQGSANVSHGCINLTNERAKEYYDSAIYGDPVIVKGSSVSLSKEDSDVSDWVYDWDEWQELSALD
ncbi:Ig-like domain-containing protein [Brevibacterium gallinarum]|uniref:L,D-transpeptidase family protein n=1 Tax=Brevibacterium gallinarum TaxID=2762220 RepID=A0ABR8WUZ5_9MICO|nr:Ig-like domain-containing protein [Brevibacterium gallinarum]MBD8020466.1 L,D-transpeptidase family protein [Brevibacterium gallinarum]